MPTYRGEIPNLHNGISQQPAVIRQVDQSQEQINAWSSVQDGLGKRQPFEHMAILDTAQPDNPKIHVINRDATERHVVVIQNGDLKVYDLATGAAQTVTFPAGKSYLTSANPFAGFHCVTVADYTFISNRNKKVALASAVADLTADPNYYYWLSRKNAQGIAFQQQYGKNDAVAASIGDVNTAQDLPDSPSEGDVYRITGYGGVQSEYVVYTGGVWNETYKTGIQNKIDPLTMPHALVRAPDGTFVFAPFSWAPRRVGDDTDNPPPSFVGRVINDVFFWKDRLGLLSDENCIFSRASDFGNFFRMTMTDLLPDEVIDVASAETDVNILYNCVPFQSLMLLFAKQSQFALTANGALTPSTVGITRTTKYHMSPNVAPVVTGEEAFFASEPESNTTSGSVVIHDYYVEPSNQQLATADDITAHVPKLIPSGIRYLAASSEYDVLFALSVRSPNVIYVYKTYWRKEEKVQSSWGTWVLDPGDSVLSVEVVEDAAIFVIQRAQGVYLERVQLVPQVAPGAMPYNVHLDRRTKVTGTYLSPSDSTEFSLPYKPNKDTFQLVLGDAWGDNTNTLLDPSTYTWTADDVLRVPGNYAAHPMFCGTTYKFKQTFSRPYVKDQEGQSVTTGSLTIQTYTVNYVGTGYFKTIVNAYGTDDSIETVVPALLAEFTGLTIGDGVLFLGTPQLADGSFTFMVQADAADAVVSLENDTHLPCVFVSAEYEALYSNRIPV